MLWGVLFRIFFKDGLKFQLDKFGDDPKTDTEYAKIKKSGQTVFCYGVFGFVTFEHESYLILIEEASIVGQILRGTVFIVDKLRFVPICADGKVKDWKQIQMIEHI